jgi:hypothetical protein
LASYFKANAASIGAATPPRLAASDSPAYAVVRAGVLTMAFVFVFGGQLLSLVIGPLVFLHAAKALPPGLAGEMLDALTVTGNHSLPRAAQSSSQSSLA